MSETLPIIIAGYAALVGTGSLGWQMFSSRVDRQASLDPGIEVTLDLAYLMLPLNPLHVVMVNASNRRGAFPVQVTMAGLDVQDGSGIFVMPVPPAGSTIPGTVNPRHSLNTWFSVDELLKQGFDLTEPVTGFVNLGTGNSVRSEPRALRSGG